MTIPATRVLFLSCHHKTCVVMSGIVPGLTQPLPHIAEAKAPRPPLAAP